MFTSLSKIAIGVSFITSSAVAKITDAPRPLEVPDKEVIYIERNKGPEVEDVTRTVGKLSDMKTGDTLQLGKEIRIDNGITGKSIKVGQSECQVFVAGAKTEGVILSKETVWKLESTPGSSGGMGYPQPYQQYNQFNQYNQYNQGSGLSQPYSQYSQGYGYYSGNSGSGEVGFGNSGTSEFRKPYQNPMQQGRSLYGYGSTGQPYGHGMPGFGSWLMFGNGKNDRKLALHCPSDFTIDELKAADLKIQGATVKYEKVESTGRTRSAEATTGRN